MNPLSSLFGAGVAVRNALYDRGVLRTHRLRWPVVSVGNLRVGGAGKTPFTIHLGEQLRSRKIPFDVLSRGYRRATTGVQLVREDGSAHDFGDEPLLIARRLGVPVIVGEDRYAAGQFAERTFGELRPAHGTSWLHLLDDGFQHRRLHRDFDIVLLTPGDAADTLLPKGRLREGLGALRRADAVVLTETTQLESLPDFVPGKHIWRTTTRLELPVKIPARPVAFCGIARPGRFLEQLEQAGVEFAAIKVFPDHYAYREADIQELLALKDKNRAGGFITTEKDELNLAAGGFTDTLDGPAVVRLHMALVDPQRAVETILSAIAERAKC